MILEKIMNRKGREGRKGKQRQGKCACRQRIDDFGDKAGTSFSFASFAVQGLD